MFFKNIDFDNIDFKTIDLFVACLGYEERSFYIYDKIKECIDVESLMLFTIDDYKTFEKHIVKKISEVKNIIVEKYDGDLSVHKKIVDRAKELDRKDKTIRIVIDYSSMPRGWYSKLPEELDKILVSGSEVYFLYSEGIYIQEADFYSTVGIESYRVISGKPSFMTNRARTHFIGVGYDAVRTQGLISILDPEEYVICEAYNPDYPDVHEAICRVNRGVIEQTSNIISMHITDIEFMITKLKGVISEYYYAGESDVILVPDGPKPLIFAMSMMPWIFDREGISCLHIIRNSKEVKKNNVKPRGGIIGVECVVE